MPGFEMNDFQISLMKQRYALPKENTWYDIAARVAAHLSKAENNGDMPIWERRFREIIANGWFFPGGRVLYGSGRRIGGLLNCFCVGIDDNRHSIAKNMHDMYIITTFGGGVGTNYSKIRPKGDSIQGVQGAAPGVVSEMRKIDAIGAEIRSGGGRRCALIAILSIDHPDVLEFLNVKLDRKELKNHNISILFNKKFFDAVKNDKDWIFSFRGQEYKVYRLSVKLDNIENRIVDIPATSQENAIITANNFYKQHYQETFEFLEVISIKATELFDRIVKNAAESGEPGFLFSDNILKNFATRYFEEFSCTNPCLVGDSIVKTTNGNYRLDKLVQMYNNNEKLPTALTYNEATNTIEEDEIIWAAKTRSNTTIIELQLDNEKILRLTPDHKIFTKNRGWVCAADLTDQDELLILADDMYTKQGLEDEHKQGECT